MHRHNTTLQILGFDQNSRISDVGAAVICECLRCVKVKQGWHSTVIVRFVRRSNV